MTRYLRMLLPAVALLVAGGQAPSPDAVIAKRGDVALTAGVARRLIDAQDPAVRQRLSTDPGALEQAVRSQVLQMVLLDEARSKKFDQDPDVVFRADQARDASIVAQYVASLTRPPADYPSDAEVQTAYDANKQQFMLPRRFHLAQVFVAVPADATNAVAASAERKAKEIRQLLAKRNADFASIAATRSDDHATAGNGGDAGWINEDKLPIPIRDAANGLQENAISAPIRTPDGWHIIKVLGSKPAGIAPLADVHDALVRAMRQQRAQQNERAYVQVLLRKAPIQLDEIQLQQVARTSGQVH